MYKMGQTVTYMGIIKVGTICGRGMWLTERTKGQIQDLDFGEIGQGLPPHNCIFKIDLDHDLGVSH